MIDPSHWRALRNELTQWFETETPSADGGSGTVIDPRQCCLIVGAHGIGKTTFLQRFIQEHHWTVQWITPDRCDSSKALNDQLNKYIYPSVGDAFAQTASSSAAPSLHPSLHRGFIGIDDWDILVGQDRSMFLTLQQFLQSKRSNPFRRRIVCLCDRSTEKKFSDLHLPVKVFTLRPMSDTDRCFVLKERFPSLNLSVLTHLADHCQENLRRAIEMAHFETSSVSASTSAPSANAVATRLKALELPEIVPSLQFMYEPKRPDEWFKLFAQDPWMTPLRFHENLYKELENRAGSKIVLYHRLHTALTDWDTFMAHWMNDEDSLWMDLPVRVLSLGVATALEPHRRLKKLKHSNASMTDFTKLLSQLSLQKKGFHTVFTQYKGAHYPIYECPYHWIHEA